MSRLQFMDRVALAAMLLLIGIGVLFVHSATSGDASSSGRWVKQMIWVGLGLFLFLVTSQIDYKRLVDRGHLFFVLGLIALAAVLLWGHKANGARSWFRIGFASIQPSEFMKVAAILMVTKFFSRVQSMNSSFLEFVASGLLVALPVFLIALQPDLGTAILFLPLVLIPNFLFGRKEAIWLSVIGGLAVAALIVTVVYRPNLVFFLKSYQKDRIVSFVFPERDTTDSGYQVHQSKISIGQGGLLGLGVGKGKQTRLGFLPEKDSDFVLAVVAEESGFLGILALFSLFLIVFQRGIQTALEAGDATGSILVTLVVSVLTFQMLFNAAMLVGLVPTTGIPCPLISYGGSSMLSTLILLGMVQSVRTHRFVNH